MFSPRLIVLFLVACFAAPHAALAKQAEPVALPSQKAKVAEKEHSHGAGGELKVNEAQKPSAHEEHAGKKEVLVEQKLLPFVTPALLAGLFAGIFFLLILCCGVNMLAQLDTPKKFVEKGLTGRFDF